MLINHHANIDDILKYYELVFSTDCAESGSVCINGTDRDFCSQQIASYHKRVLYTSIQG